MNKSKLYEQTVKLAEQGKLPTKLDVGISTGPVKSADGIIGGAGVMPDLHTIADIASIGVLFLGPIGLLASAGIQLANAALYASEGNTKEAGLATVLALLPGLPKVLNKIPGLDKMTQKGFDALIKAVRAKKVTPAQKVILNKIGVNKDFIKKEIESLIKTKAKNNAAKIAASTLSPAKKTALQKLGQGTIQLGTLGTKMAALSAGQKGVEAGYNVAYDFVMPTYDELVAKHQQSNLSYLDKQLDIKLKTKLKTK